MKSKVFECLACHFKWTTPAANEPGDIKCPECGHQNPIAKTDINKSIGDTKYIPGAEAETREKAGDRNNGEANDL